MKIPLAGALLLSTALCTTAQNITTMPSWNGSSFISSFGVTNTATYGQTITIPSGPNQTLSSFTFQIGNCSNAVTFRGHVYAFNGSSATGSSLFDSAPITIPASSGTFQAVTVVTPGVTLAPGLYTLFVSTSEDQAGALNSACRFGFLTADDYSGGNFYFLNNGSSPAQWTTVAWSVISRDLAFTAVLTGGAPAPVPTLSEWGMILLSVLLAGAGYHYLLSQSKVHVSIE